MGQDRPVATLSRSRPSSDRSDDAAHASRTASADSAPAVEQPALGDIATAPAMGGLALVAGPGLLRASSAVADPLGGNPIPDSVLSALRRRRGGGQPLTSGVASQIGDQLGPAASAARIHTDGEADRLARSVQSVAFSYGSDVYFTQGAYAPNSQAGQRLLAHELSHVRQSASGLGGGGAIIGRADDAAERDADRSADQVLGALRRQAARRATPACGHAGQDSDVHAAPAGHGALPALARTASELVRRAYTEQERPDVLALPQLENSQERLNALEAHNWSKDDTVRLATQQPAPTYAELNTIMGRLTAAQLADIQPSCASVAELLALIATAWPAADLARHAAFHLRPTAVELQAVIAFFTPEQVDAVLGVSGNWADIVALAATGWAADDLARVAGNGEPSVEEFKMVVNRFTADQFDELCEPEAFSWTHLANLADAAEPAAQSPAITLRDALATCNSLVTEDVNALAEMGLRVSPRRYQALLIGTETLDEHTDYNLVTAYLKDARWFSICFDTAQRLFDDLGNVPANSSGGEKADTYSQVEQRSRARLLVTHLNGASAAGTPVIFNIHVGGHGFSLTVIGPKVYQMEAFASQADDDADVLANFEDLSASLVTSIRANNTYAIGDVTAAIIDMTSTSRRKRTQAAQVMGWNPGPCGFLDDDGNVTDPMVIWWESASLHTNAQIVTNIALRIQRQRVEIRKRFGITDDNDDDADDS